MRENVHSFIHSIVHSAKKSIDQSYFWEEKGFCIGVPTFYFPPPRTWLCLDYLLLKKIQIFLIIIPRENKSVIVKFKLGEEKWRKIEDVRKSEG